eukprot:TRINITY_DN58_c0_g1_i13.p1 TRINITY_DN58_c0_g1~~TRINITY_DN58_c0_g1_i13.p1  ORF type:complete len:1869 (-),score=642.30 TRINITY_DN58_c0_g1_i13:327-5933(-)
MATNEWSDQFDPTSGKVYWLKNTTGESQWHVPYQKEPWCPQLDASSGATYFQHMLTGETAWAAPADCWEAFHDPESKTNYYYNHLTGEYVYTIDELKAKCGLVEVKETPPPPVEVQPEPAPTSEQKSVRDLIAAVEKVPEKPVVQTSPKAEKKVIVASTPVAETDEKPSLVSPLKTEGRYTPETFTKMMESTDDIKDAFTCINITASGAFSEDEFNRFAEDVTSSNPNVVPSLANAWRAVFAYVQPDHAFMLLTLGEMECVDESTFMSRVDSVLLTARDLVSSQNNGSFGLGGPSVSEKEDEPVEPMTDSSKNSAALDSLAADIASMAVTSSGDEQLSLLKELYQDQLESIFASAGNKPTVNDFGKLIPKMKNILFDCEGVFDCESLPKPAAVNEIVWQMYMLLNTLQHLESTHSGEVHEVAEVDEIEDNDLDIHDHQFDPEDFKLSKAEFKKKFATFLQTLSQRQCQSVIEMCLQQGNDYQKQVNSTEHIGDLYSRMLERLAIHDVDRKIERKGVTPAEVFELCLTLSGNVFRSMVPLISHIGIDDCLAIFQGLQDRFPESERLMSLNIDQFYELFINECQTAIDNEKPAEGASPSTLYNSLLNLKRLFEDEAILQQLFDNLDLNNSEDLSMVELCEALLSSSEVKEKCGALLEVMDVPKFFLNALNLLFEGKTEEEKNEVYITREYFIEVFRVFGPNLVRRWKQKHKTFLFDVRNEMKEISEVCHHVGAPVSGPTESPARERQRKSMKMNASPLKSSMSQRFPPAVNRRQSLTWYSSKSFRNVSKVASDRTEALLQIFDQVFDEMDVDCSGTVEPWEILYTIGFQYSLFNTHFGSVVRHFKPDDIFTFFFPNLRSCEIALDSFCDTFYNFSIDFYDQILKFFPNASSLVSDDDNEENDDDSDNGNDSGGFVNPMMMMGNPLMALQGGVQEEKEVPKKKEVVKKEPYPLFNLTLRRIWRVMLQGLLQKERVQKQQNVFFESDNEVIENALNPVRVKIMQKALNDEIPSSSNQEEVDEEELDGSQENIPKKEPLSTNKVLILIKESRDVDILSLIFTELDRDLDGELSLQEFLYGCAHETALFQHFGFIFEFILPINCFRILDYRQLRGRVTKEQFLQRFKDVTKAFASVYRKHRVMAATGESQLEDLPFISEFDENNSSPTSEKIPVPSSTTTPSDGVFGMAADSEAETKSTFSSKHYHGDSDLFFALTNGPAEFHNRPFMWDKVLQNIGNWDLDCDRMRELALDNKLLRAIFEEIDVNKDGIIAMNEFLRALQFQSKHLIKKDVSTLDPSDLAFGSYNTDTVMLFYFFGTMVHVILKRKLLNLFEMFKVLDLNHDGSITVDEFEQRFPVLISNMIHLLRHDSKCPMIDNRVGASELIRRPTAVDKSCFTQFLGDEKTEEDEIDFKSFMNVVTSNPAVFDELTRTAFPSLEFKDDPFVNGMKLFRLLDVDDSGTISFEEFKARLPLVLMNYHSEGDILSNNINNGSLNVLVDTGNDTKVEHIINASKDDDTLGAIFDELNPSDDGLVYLVQWLEYYQDRETILYDVFLKHVPHYYNPIETFNILDAKQEGALDYITFAVRFPIFIEMMMKLSASVSRSLIVPAAYLREMFRQMDSQGEGALNAASFASAMTLVMDLPKSKSPSKKKRRSSAKAHEMRMNSLLYQKFQLVTKDSVQLFQALEIQNDAIEMSDFVCRFPLLLLRGVLQLRDQPISKNQKKSTNAKSPRKGSGHVQRLGTYNILHQGYASKHCQSLFKKYKKRYLVLLPDRIVYFQSKNDLQRDAMKFHEKSDLTGVSGTTLKLNNAVLHYNEDTAKSSSFVLALKEMEQGRNNYVFKAASADESLKWAQTLSTVLPPDCVHISSAPMNQ